ncbi:Ohr subfamily peroxiredoxin [Actinoplanes lutulentus]|uniref:Ohr subfamily peroxiredoxin n=1 Tax=Actinoplanes lutulentus TaxID=1287878 RepID=A0A327Z152_9ACTN|nr:Ohr family peroxiredoxin [Actinoplanes lutulentus]MBB2946496.1 Ohr subfamily peroxiredoxin [Actinoplanes lutulentus]RAK26414.1 Ohr subfamily peroxiredoxin [Actinoplanes lutulentus]
MSHIYTAKAHVAGGRNGHGRSDDGHLDVALSRPASGGPGTNPEQLFAVAYAACFEGALSTVARRARVDLGQTSVESSVSLSSVDDGSFRIDATLAVTIPGVTDAGQAVELATEADRVCPYSNALRGNVDVAITANGQWVAGPRD